MKAERQDDLYKKIADSVSEEPVPESLKPEEVERLLKAQGRIVRETTENKKKSWNWKKPFYGLAGTAAVLALALILVVNGWVPRLGRDTKDVRKELKASKSAKDENGLDIEGIFVAKDYDQIWELLYARSNNRYYAFDDVEDVAVKSASDQDVGLQMQSDTLVNESKVEAANDIGTVEELDAAGASDDYSTTNVQEEGVGEADRILTDGTYIYTLGYQKGASEYSNYRSGDEKEAIYIFQPDEAGKLQQLSVLDLQKDGLRIQEMYLQENRLVVLAARSWTNGNMYDGYKDYTYEYAYRGETYICTYDITDRTAPKEIGKLCVEGFYDTSRLVGGYLYVFTSYSGQYYMDEEDRKDHKKYVPCVQGEELEPGEVYIPDIEQAQGYLVGVSVNVSEPGTIADRFAVMMNSETYYISQNNIYIAETNYGRVEQTKINKFSYEDGKMEPVAAGSVDGWLNDNFSMDEHDGYLRLVTTKDNMDQWGAMLDDVEYTTVNQLYVLDGQMQIVGKIENLAKGERIYSARFMGNVGYFVTYRQVDPLFSVDLSDPSNPVILGELKISGFSEYLHPYGENRLLGIGWETTYYEDSGRTVRDGMKLAMFDTTDLGNVQQAGKLVDEEVVENASQYDYKAVLVNVKKNLFGFAVTKKGGENLYCTYRYDESQGFVQATQTELAWEYGIDDIRAVYIGDILYIQDFGRMISVSLQDGSILNIQPF